MRNRNLHKRKTIDLRVLVMMILLILMVLPRDIEKADAQVFILSEEEYNHTDRAGYEIGGFVPVAPNDLEEDYFPAPLGSGLLLTLGLAGSYWLAKKRKSED